MSAPADPVTPDTLTDAMVEALLADTMEKIRNTKSTETTYDAYFQLTFLRYHCMVGLGERRARRTGSRANSRQQVCDAINARAQENGNG